MIATTRFWWLQVHSYPCHMGWAVHALLPRSCFGQGSQTYKYNVVPIIQEFSFSLNDFVTYHLLTWNVLMTLASYCAAQSVSMSAAVNWRCLGTLKPIDLKIQASKSSMRPWRWSVGLSNWSTKENWGRSVCSAWRRLTGDLTAFLLWCYTYLMRGCSTDGAKLFSKQHSNSTKGNEHKLKHQQLWLAIRRKKKKNHHEDGHSF